MSHFISLAAGAPDAALRHESLPTRAPRSCSTRRNSAQPIEVGYGGRFTTTPRSPALAAAETSRRQLVGSKTAFRRYGLLAPRNPPQELVISRNRTSGQSRATSRLWGVIRTHLLECRIWTAGATMCGSHRLYVRLDSALITAHWKHPGWRQPCLDDNQFGLCRHLVPRPAFEGTPGLFLLHPAPLLEKKWHTCLEH
jgi:hypothetical protein